MDGCCPVNPRSKGGREVGVGFHLKKKKNLEAFLPCRSHGHSLTIAETMTVGGGTRIIERSEELSFLLQGSCGTAASDSGPRPDVEFIRPVSLLFCTQASSSVQLETGPGTSPLSTEHTQDGPRLMCS